MSKVFVNIALSLDGYLAPEGMTMVNWDRPGWWADKWGKLMSWALDQQYLREKLKLGSGGQTGPVNHLIRHSFERTGAHIMGRRMFDGGERGWPEEAPFHTPALEENRFRYPGQEGAGQVPQGYAGKKRATLAHKR